MNADQVRDYCHTLPCITEQVQWGKDRVFKIAGKMFVCMGEETNSRYSFKVADERFLELTDLPGIVPAPYLARAKWVQIDPANVDLPAGEVRSLVKSSYDLVLSKLPKKTQAAVASGSL